MKSATCLGIFLMQIFLFEGGYCSNSSTQPTDLQLKTTLVLSGTVTEPTPANPYNEPEMTEMFTSNGSLGSKEKLWNNAAGPNCTTVAEGSSDLAPAFRLPNSAAVGAGVFVISALVGYISCLGYRRFLQRKYGNSQILIGEEVYDTSDLRNFEI